MSIDGNELSQMIVAIDRHIKYNNAALAELSLYRIEEAMALGPSNEEQQCQP